MFYVIIMFFNVAETQELPTSGRTQLSPKSLRRIQFSVFRSPSVVKAESSAFFKIHFKEQMSLKTDTHSPVKESREQGFFGQSAVHWCDLFSIIMPRFVIFFWMEFKYFPPSLQFIKPCVCEPRQKLEQPRRHQRFQLWVVGSFPLQKKELSSFFFFSCCENFHPLTKDQAGALCSAHTSQLRWNLCRRWRNK